MCICGFVVIHIYVYTSFANVYIRIFVNLIIRLSVYVDI